MRPNIDDGSVTITKSISSVNDGVGTAGCLAESSLANGVTINDGAFESVRLRGL
jgi:hypothetical protein